MQTTQKVFNNTKNLFCYVAHYCNLVAEFNGLVSKKGRYFYRPFFIYFYTATFFLIILKFKADTIFI